MSLVEWRALIEAYLDGRISPESFSRRLLDAFAVAKTAGARAPRAIVDLHDVAEAFEADSQGHEGERDDDELRTAARRALAQLGDDAPAPRMQWSSAGGAPELRAFQVGFSGCAGVGCLIGLIWVGLCLLQVYYVSEAIQHAFGWGALPAAVLGVVLAFIPIVGNVLAFLGATSHGWPSWAAALVFFAAPAAALISGWARMRRFR